MQHPLWLEAFNTVIDSSTAGLPQDPTVKWTHLSHRQLGEKMQQTGIIVSRYQIKKMLALRAYKKRKLLKMNELKQVPGRNEQFDHIHTLRQSFIQEDLPILSIDTKKKELLGNFHRPGSNYSTAAQKVNDHDFLSFADGQLVPHGIYDVRENTGYMTLGTSKDTSEFTCDNLRQWWLSALAHKYPKAHTLLLLCDGGGANSCLHYIFKQDLVKLANGLAINILVAHYPAYCSKYNPIEHRLFSQITHTWSGMPLRDLQFVKELTDTTTTRTGLKVSTIINTKTYQTKREVRPEFKDNIENYIRFDDKCPKWNYLVKAKN